MKAIATTDFGAPVTLVEISTPEPGEGEILVRVASSSINGFDLSVASGRLKGMMEHRFPVVLGKDFAGTVESTGAGVDGFAEGDTVVGVVMKPELGDGSFGERVATPAAFAAKVPDGVDAATAGALGLAGTAAHDAVEAVELQQGETVLVSGATGGVGIIAVQLLKARGAYVIATASTDDEIAFVRGDVALASIMANPVTATLAKLADAAAAGIIRVPVTRTYGLEDVPQGLADFAAGTLGKLAVRVHA